MKKLLSSLLIVCILACIASCGTTQNAVTTTSSTTNTTSDLFKAGEQLGAALKFFSDQKATNGKINYEDPTTYLQMAVIVQNANAVIDTLVNKIANSETGKKVQDNATNAKGWIDEHQDTIDAINVLLNTLK